MNDLELRAVPCRVQLPQAVGSVRLQRLAGYVLVRRQSAFTLAWDGASAVYIKMSPEFLGWTRGLCGNNNADPQDDLVTSSGEMRGKRPPKGLAGGGGRVRLGGVGEALGQNPGVMVLKTQREAKGPSLASVWPQACS